ncbi:RsmB/NOP family class I SAM-dependent RNA methyltransferase [Chelatococcus sp. GCM10030263]|uniref:RsmB/NOP family class I SAM-dependent RNA methyltransferase n=1 Tax=Chelatococcus sp. GCM10030263 TaxID=3273387 RepID=UPI00360F75A9
MKASVPARAAARPKKPRRDEAPGLAARRLAVAALTRVLQDRQGLDEAFEDLGNTPEFKALAARDVGLARAIATSACRRLGTIRGALAQRLPRGLPRKAGALEAILVAGSAQLLLLDVPDHAAVATAVDLARGDGRAFPYAKLVNAVLRRIAGERDAILAAADPLDVDTPAWLRARWISAYGEETARAIAAAHRNEPALDLTVKGDAEIWAEQLGGTVLATGSVRLAAAGRQSGADRQSGSDRQAGSERQAGSDRVAVADLAGYGEGAWWVQDAAAALPARLLGARPGEEVIDLCAAPGGKTAQLAAAGAHVVAVDRSGTRLKRLAANMERLRLTVTVQEAEAESLTRAPVDAVLLDAPCSATGTIRRHPDVAWTKREADVTALAVLQARLLEKAADLVKPGGRLVYCTCSLEPEEGERQIEAFLARHDDFRRMPITADDLGGLSPLVTAAGDLRSLPHQAVSADGDMRGLDGFYAARLRRAPAPG